MDDDRVTRRTYLNSLLATGLAASIAGCNTSSDGSNSNSTTESTTSAPNQAPEILAQDAKPQDNGTTLTVSLNGEDDHKISLARIEYAGKAVEEIPESASVTLESKFTELGATDLNETPGQVTYVLRDIDGKETRAEVRPDETAPELHTFSATPTENAGEISLVLEGQDDIGLENVAANLLGEKSLLNEDVAGQQEFRIDQNVSVAEDARFRQSTVTASLRDWNGNTTESETDTYVRKFDAQNDLRLDIGAVYLPWMGGKFGGILSRDEVEPTVGYYDSLVEQQNELVNQHIDQMEGHGINKVMFSFGANDAMHQAFNNFEKAATATSIEVETFYGLPSVFRFDRDIEKDYNFIRENVLSKSNHSTVGDRPIIQFWAPSFLLSHRDQIERMYGSPEEFVKYTRRKLTQDGVKPFLVADAAGQGYHNGFGDEAFWASWDGLTNWVGVVESQKTIPNEQATKWLQKEYKGIAEFAQKHNQDFYPLIYPGFNDTHNEEWGQNRRIPRSTKAFRERLQLAEKYADGRINIYSFNEWAEGSQIEAGTFLNNDYATAYLEIVEDFQTPN